MPLFEYKCSKCGHVMEFLEKSGTASKHTCERCKSPHMQKLLSGFAVGHSSSTSKPSASCPTGTCPLSYKGLSMKIAITSTGKTLDSQVDQRFGRAAYFIIVDTETTDFSVIDNENIAAAGGAGISSAKAVTDAAAQAVLTGNCGPNAQRTLSAAGVKLYTRVTGTVRQAVELFKSGELTEAAGPNVQAHFGVDK